LALRYGVVPTWGLALGILVGVAGFAAVTYWVVSRSSGPPMSAASGFGRAFRFSVPSHMANLTQFLNYRFDIFVIGYFVGLSGVGLYVLASVMAESVWLVSRAVAAVLFPYVASTPEADRRLDATIRSVRMSLTVSVALALLLGLLALPILRFAFGASFLASHVPLLWLLPGVTMFSIVYVLSAYFSGIGRPGVNFIRSGVGLLVTVPLALYLVPRFGIVGASIATSISYGASTVVAMSFFVREGGVSLKALLILQKHDLRSLAKWGSELRKRLHKP
jgi:O-antigen/teichoic acid export membrane protein